MSDFSRVTRHPNNSQYAVARWHDNYFGAHRYGVEFPGDAVVYPASQVEEAQLKEFWADDVLATLRDSQITALTEPQIVQWLEDLQVTYKDRWNRDPATGEAALAIDIPF